MAALNDYIEFRYPNWLDYARHMATVHHFEGWETDLLNDVILNLLQKPADKLNGMLARKTKKQVNGLPTTELDKFVLKMLHMNAFSPVAPFRKNVLGNKIIDRNGARVTTRQQVELNGADFEDGDQYDAERFTRLDAMHTGNMQRLKRNEFNREAARLYKLHFIHGMPLAEFSETEQDEIEQIRRFLTAYEKTLFDD